MIQTKSWEITDEFWEEVKDLIPEKQRDPNKEYKRIAGGGRPPMDSRKVLEAIFLYFEQVYNGRRYLLNIVI